MLCLQGLPSSTSPLMRFSILYLKSVAIWLMVAKENTKGGCIGLACSIITDVHLIISAIVWHKVKRNDI